VFFHDFFGGIAATHAVELAQDHAVFGAVFVRGIPGARPAA
jgi:hypothetical protein